MIAILICTATVNIVVRHIRHHYELVSGVVIVETLEAIDELEMPVAGVIATLLDTRGVVEAGDEVAAAARPRAWRFLRY
jgi:hypothetical protein